MKEPRQKSTLQIFSEPPWMTPQKNTPLERIRKELPTRLIPSPRDFSFEVHLASFTTNSSTNRAKLHDSRSETHSQPLSYSLLKDKALFKIAVVQGTIDQGKNDLTTGVMERGIENG